MLRSLRYIFLGLLAVALLAVASANRTPVTVRLLPPEMDSFFDAGLSLELPLFLVIFAGIIAGLAIGFVWEWFREAKIRAEASQHKRKVVHLEREVTRLKGASGEKQDEVLTLLERKTGT